MGRMRLLLVAVAGAAFAVVLTVGIQAVEGQGSNVTYYGCLKSGDLSQVGVTTPANCATKHVISWNSQGPQGPPGPGGVNGLQEFTSSGTFTVPSGITQILVSAVGAGGGGDHACVPGSQNSEANFGGFAGWIEGTITVTPGDQYQVVVGTAGTGATYPSGSATAGTASEIVAPNGTVLGSAGGGEGATPTNCANAGNSAGAPGTATISGGMAETGGAPYHLPGSVMNAGSEGAGGNNFPGESQNGGPGGSGDLVIQW